MLPAKNLELTLDITKLKATLNSKPELFNIYPDRLGSKGPHRESNDIWVRYGDFHKYGQSVFTEPHESVWYPVIEKIPEVADIALAIMARVGGERLGGILITKLPPGKKVYSHIDTVGWHPNYYEKFYIPIQSAKGATFEFDDVVLDEINSPEGSVSWFRNDVPHWVYNDSEEDRIAMVVCIRPTKKGFLNV